MSALAEGDGNERRQGRRIPTFWERQLLNGWPCRICSTSKRAWTDPHGHVWEICRVCDVDVPVPPNVPSPR